MTRFTVSVAAFVLGVIVILGVLYFLHGDTESTARVYGDWRLNCPPASANVSRCALTQDIMQSGTGVTLIHLEYSKFDDAQRLTIVVPHGVLVKPGLGFGIGKAPLRILKYLTCDQVGCVVLMPLDRATFTALQGGGEGRIVIVARNGQEAAFPYSLNGFADGAGMLGWEAFKRSSWLGRLLP
jgi:invasion protein IalB